MSAWDHFVSGMSVWEDPNHETFAAATRAHRSALELEPNYVLSLGQLAVVIGNRILFGEVSDRDVARVEACQLADRAIAQGGKSPIALFSSVNVLAELCGEANKAVQIGRRMVLAYPDSGYNQTILGNALTYSGELEEALRVLEAAERNFPDNIYVARYSPLFKAINYSHRDKWDNVVEVTRTALNLDPSDVYAMYPLANGLGVLNRAEEAKEVWSQLLGRFPNMTVESYEWFLQHGYVSDERIEPLVRGLKRAGLQAQ